MGELQHIIKLNDDQLETLMTAGSITVGETTIELDLYGLYLTADEDKYVLYSSTGTVTTATPSAGTDAVNLDYFNANLPVAKTYYRHRVIVVYGDYIEQFNSLDTIGTIKFEVYNSSASALTYADLIGGTHAGYADHRSSGYGTCSAEFGEDSFCVRGYLNNGAVEFYGTSQNCEISDTVTEL